jgi:hypothetical protein
MKDMPFILLTLDEEQTPTDIPWISCREIEGITLPSIHSLYKIQDIEKLKHLAISPDDIQGKMKEMSFVWPILDEGLILKERANLWISSKEIKNGTSLYSFPRWDPRHREIKISLYIPRWLSKVRWKRCLSSDLFWTRDLYQRKELTFGSHPRT